MARTALVNFSSIYCGFDVDVAEISCNFWVEESEDNKNLYISDYAITMLNYDFIEETLFDWAGRFFRSFAVYKKTGVEPQVVFLNQLTAKYYNVDPKLNTMHRYVEEILSYIPMRWNDDFSMYPQHVPPSPTHATWRFEDGIAIKPDEFLFDKRIIIEWTWNIGDQVQHFKGFWYVTSVEFLRARADQIDPYYRRFTYICEHFDSDAFGKYLQEETDRIIGGADPRHVANYLYENCEVEGEECNYER